MCCRRHQHALPDPSGHLAQYAVDQARKSHAKDLFGFAMLEQGRYTAAQIDDSVWDLSMLQDLEEFLQRDPSCTEYRSLNWDLERNAAKGDPVALAELLRTRLQ